MMNLKHIQKLVDASLIGFAQQEIIFNRQGKPIDFRFIDANPAFTKFLGIDAENFIGKTLSETIQWQDKNPSSLSRLYSRFPFEGKELEFELFFEQSEQWLLVQFVISENNLLDTILTNINHRKTPLVQQQEYRKTIQSFWNKKLLAIFITDKRGKFIDANNEACKLTGYDYSELVGMKFFDIIGPDDQLTIRKLLQSIDESGEILEEVNYFTKKGNNRIGKFEISKLNQDSTLILLSDNTEYILQDKAIIQSEKKYAFLAETANELIGQKNTQDLYIYVAKKLNQLLNGHSIVAVVDYDNERGKWKMQHLEGVGNKMAKLAKLFGFDLLKMEGQIYTNYYNKISSGKLVEVALDFPSFFDNKVSETAKDLVKKFLSFEKMYCIAIQKTNRPLGNITFITNKKTGVVDAELIEAFINQVNNIIDKHYFDQALSERNVFIDKVLYSLPGTIVYLFDLKKKSNVYSSNSINELLDFLSKDSLAIGDKEYKELIHPDDLKAFVDHFNSLASCSDFDIRKIEYRIRHSRGHYIWIESHDTIFNFDPSGVALQTIGSVREITNQKLAQTALIESKELYKNLVESTSAVAWELDFASQKFVYISPQIEKISGYTPVQLKDFNFWANCMHPDDRNAAVDFCLSETRNLRDHTFEYRVITAQKQTIWLRDVVSVISSGGKPITLRGFFIDITEAKEAESQLIKLSQAVEQSPVSVIIANLNGNIEYVNPKYTEITGYSKAEAINQNLGFLNPGFIDEDIYSNLWKTTGAGKVWKGEFRNQKKNGELFWEAALISPIFNKTGNITHFIALKEDITNRKALEEDLKRETLLRELLMVISSDFINIPLEHIDNAIKNSLEKMALFVNSDHAYTFDYDWKKLGCSKTGEWYKPELNPINCQQNNSTISLPEMIEIHKKGEPMIIPNVNELPSSQTKDFFQSQQVLSFITVPMMNDKLCTGFVGFDSVNDYRTYSDTELQLLKIFAQMLANVKARKEMVNEIISAKTEAEKSDEKHRTLIEQMLEGLIVDDGTGIIQYVNPMFCHITGYDEHELVGKMGYNFLLLDKDKNTIKSKDEDRKNNISEQYEIEILTKTGEIRICWFHATPIINKQGIVSGSMSTVSDITENKKDQERIRITKDTYESIFNSVKEAIYVINQDGCFIDVNHGAEIMYGYSNDELIGKSPADVAAPGLNNLTEIAATISNVAKTGIAESFEFWGVRKNGTQFPKDVIINRGKYFGEEMIIATARDITERKRTEIARKAQYNIARSIHWVKNTEELLEIIRLELGELFDTTNFFVAKYNSEKQQLKQLIFKDENDSFDHWDANDSISGYVAKTGKTLYLRGIEIEILTKSNNLKSTGTEPACWLGVPVSKKNKVIAVMVLQHYTNYNAYSEADVNLIEMVAHEMAIYLERQAMIEDLIVAKNKAEESTRLKSAFLANMSHEIRTPMNGILGFSELLKRPDLTGDQQKKYIEMIRKSGTRMLNIINDIVDISKIEAGLMELKLSESIINEQLDYIFTFFKPEVDAKGIGLSFSTPLENKEAVIITDREKLYAILINLVKNAIKYTETGEIKFGYLPLSDGMQFFVRDTGIGIPKDRQKAIFEPFVQADIEDVMARQGAGLGLSISKAYVEMMGGKLWVESLENKGSTFYFKLPFIDFPNKETIPIEPTIIEKSGSKTPSIKLLIVEDDEASMFLLELELHDMCKNILFAKTGIDALNICRKNENIDLILMDIRLPGMDGFEVTRQIREFNTDVIIIAQTAYGLSGDKARALQAGCNDYVAKPIKMTNLRQLIKNYFDNKPESKSEDV